MSNKLEIEFKNNGFVYNGTYYLYDTIFKINPIIESPTYCVFSLILTQNSVDIRYDLIGDYEKELDEIIECVKIEVAEARNKLIDILESRK